jgi:outer membrane protein assembly factor BamB
MFRSERPKRWQVDAAGLFGGPPHVTAGRVVVPCADHRVYVLDAATGSVVWGYRRSDGTPMLEFPPPSVAYQRGLIYLTEPEPGGQLLALDGEAEVRWEQPLDGAPGRDVVAASTAGGDDIVVAGTATHLYCFDAGSGEPRWRFAHGDPAPAAWGRPLVLTDLVVGPAYRLSGQVGRGHTSIVVALDRTDGRERWRVRTEEHGTRVAGDDDLVLVATTEGRLAAHDSRSGTLRWQRQFQEGVYPEVSWEVERLRGGRQRMFYTPVSAELTTPVIAGDRVWVGCGNGHVYLLERGSGDIVTRWATAMPPTSLSLVDGVIYVGCHAGVLAAHRADDAGDEIWWQQIPTGSVAGVTVDAGTLYVSAGTHLATFDAATGNGPPTWRRRTTRGP